MEEIGAKVTMLTLDSVQGGGLPFLTWLLERCKRPEVAITDIFSEEAIAIFAERLATPLQFIHYAWRVLEKPMSSARNQSMWKQSRTRWPRI